MAVSHSSAPLAGLAGIAFSLYTSSGDSLSAVDVELDSIAAAAIGGRPLVGGSGSGLDTFFGVLIGGLIQSYANIDGSLSSWRATIATDSLPFAPSGLGGASTVLASRRRASTPAAARR